jgi:hypothetical protein
MKILVSKEHGTVSKYFNMLFKLAPCAGDGFSYNHCRKVDFGGMTLKQHKQLQQRY